MSHAFRVLTTVVATLSLGLPAACGDTASTTKPPAKPAKVTETPAEPAAAAKAGAQEAPAPKPAGQEAPPKKADEPAAAAPKAAEPAVAKPDTAPPAAIDDAAVKQIDAFIASKKIDKSAANWKTSLPKPELATFNPEKSYFWDIKTNKGDMRFKLNAELAPMHVSNAIYLTRLGFYDGTPMHRVIKSFMAQGGCPLGNGMGGPGYKLNLEVTPKAKHDKRGVLSTANSGKNTDGSQYFIMFAPNAGLDGGYSIYGEMVSGDDTLTKIEALGKDRDPAPPSEKIFIEKATLSVE